MGTLGKTETDTSDETDWGELSWWQENKQGGWLFFGSRLEIGYDLGDWAMPLRVHGGVCFHLLCLYFDFTRAGHESD